jgi:hypothetical protein
LRLATYIIRKRARRFVKISMARRRYKKQQSKAVSNAVFLYRIEGGKVLFIFVYFAAVSAQFPGGEKRQPLHHSWGPFTGLFFFIIFIISHTYSTFLFTSTHKIIMRKNGN